MNDIGGKQWNKSRIKFNFTSVAEEKKNSEKKKSLRYVCDEIA